MAIATRTTDETKKYLINKLAAAEQAMSDCIAIKRDLSAMDDATLAAAAGLVTADATALRAAYVEVARVANLTTQATLDAALGIRFR